jgi:predicted phosphodiesterase
MRTAIVSDLHLGSPSGRDLLREPRFRDALLAEVATADRLVVLGDFVELFELPVAQAFEQARPFVERLGEAMEGRPVLLVPGNHDHLLARPLLRGLAGEGRALGLEHRFGPDAELTERLARWLGGARLELAYPGAWLREDVYATHGHYLDCYRRLPRLECIAAAVVMRARGPVPAPASPDDFERILGPIYAFVERLARVGITHLLTRPSERVWRTISAAEEDDRRGRGVGVRRGASTSVHALNLALRSDIYAELPDDALSRTGIAAAATLARRLGIEADHVITGHTHRPGPLAGEEDWVLAGGGRLHNTGSWILTSSFQAGGAEASRYRPGTVTWLEESGPPRRVRCLDGNSPAELRAVAPIASQGAAPPPSAAL